MQHLTDCWVIVMCGVFDTDHCNASFCNQHAEQLAEVYQFAVIYAGITVSGNNVVVGNAFESFVMKQRNPPESFEADE